MGYGYHYGHAPEPPRRRGWLFGCMVTLVVLVFLLLALVLGALFYLKPRLSQQAGGFLAGQLDEQINRKIEEQVGGAGGQVPADFSGQIVITEADVNDYIQANPQDIAPLDSASVRFVPGEMQATVAAYGLSGTASAGVAVGPDGGLVVVNPRIDGALSFVLDANQLAESLQTQLNAQLASNGQRISLIEVQQGQIIAEVQR